MKLRILRKTKHIAIGEPRFGGWNPTRAVTTDTLQYRTPSSGKWISVPVVDVDTKQGGDSEEPKMPEPLKDRRIKEGDRVCYHCGNGETYCKCEMPVFKQGGE